MVQLYSTDKLPAAHSTLAMLTLIKASWYSPGRVTEGLGVWEPFGQGTLRLRSPNAQEGRPS